VLSSSRLLYCKREENEIKAIVTDVGIAAKIAGFIAQVATIIASL
jgi:hypothetical protein